MFPSRAEELTRALWSPPEWVAAGEARGTERGSWGWRGPPGLGRRAFPGIPSVSSRAEWGVSRSISARGREGGIPEAGAVPQGW